MKLKRDDLNSDYSKVGVFHKGLHAAPCIALALWVAMTGTACQQAEIRAELFVSGLDGPVFVTSEPEDASRLFVVENKTARVRIVDGGQLVQEPFLDIGSKVESSGGEQGMFGLAFHPDYGANGRFFVSYSALDDATVVEEYRVSENPNLADPDSGRVVLRVAQPQDTHNGGMIAFGPKDGYLYVSLGDGGHLQIPSQNAQDLATPLGSILRIDIDGVEPFAIPPDNPFVGLEGADPAIWAYGLRNPWRFSFDRLTGDLYIGDVGQFALEEIDFQPFDSPGGENYGWPVAEGFACFGGLGDCGTNPGFTPPVHDYSILLTSQAVGGGYVYRGTAIPDFVGHYIFCDIINSDFFSFRIEDGNLVDFVDRTLELEAPDPLTSYSGIPSFGEDADGELYFMDFSGNVFKIVADDTMNELLSKVLGGIK